MRAIAERAARGELPVDVRAVDQRQAAGRRARRRCSAGHSDRRRCRRATIRIGQPTTPRSRTASLRYEPRLVVLAGFMRILTPYFIDAFAGRILNVHPSLLPKYRGLHTHRRALEAGDRDAWRQRALRDQGTRRRARHYPVARRRAAGRHGSTLSARVQQQEHRIYPQAIDWFARGRLQLRDDRVWLDGRPLDDTDHRGCEDDRSAERAQPISTMLLTTMAMALSLRRRGDRSGAPAPRAFRRDVRGHAIAGIEAGTLTFELSQRRRQPAGTCTRHARIRARSPRLVVSGGANRAQHRSRLTPTACGRWSGISMTASRATKATAICSSTGQQARRPAGSNAKPVALPDSSRAAGSPVDPDRGVDGAAARSGTRRRSR